MSEQPINDGGPAFPCEEQIRCNGEVCDISKFTGMTLRDYFAGKAIEALIVRGWGLENASGKAYEIADAMLKARGSK
jgi:hypothetical protein